MCFLKVLLTTTSQRDQAEDVTKVGGSSLGSAEIYMGCPGHGSERSTERMGPEAEANGEFLHGGYGWFVVAA